MWTPRSLQAFIFMNLVKNTNPFMSFHTLAITMSMLIFISSAPAWASEKPQLSGIIYDQQNPEKSLAIVDGSFVEQGGSIAGVQVLKILKTRFEFKNFENQESFWISIDPEAEYERTSFQKQWEMGTSGFAWKESNG